MEFNATIDLIIKDLNDACQIIDDLKSYPGVPELQVELAKAKCKSAGDVISLLKNIKQQPVPPKIEKITDPVNKYEQPAITDEKKAPVKPVKVKPDTEEREKKAEKKILAEKSDNIKPGSAIIADKFTNMPASINEQLGTRKSDDDVTEIIKSKHINSLNAAIGINDRFLFIRELFDGNKDTYEQAISRLESIETVADAKAVIISYTGNNTENEAVKQLLDLVKRKLTPNE
jgi:hypothetical protein